MRGDRGGLCSQVVPLSKDDVRVFLNSLSSFKMQTPCLEHKTLTCFNATSRSTTVTSSKALLEHFTPPNSNESNDIKSEPEPQRLTAATCVLKPITVLCQQPLAQNVYKFNSCLQRTSLPRRCGHRHHHCVFEEHPIFLLHSQFKQSHSLKNMSCERT